MPEGLRGKEMSEGLSPFFVVNNHGRDLVVDKNAYVNRK